MNFSIKLLVFNFGITNFIKFTEEEQISKDLWAIKTPGLRSCILNVCSALYRNVLRGKKYIKRLAFRELTASVLH